MGIDTCFPLVQSIRNKLVADHPGLTPAEVDSALKIIVSCFDLAASIRGVSDNNKELEARGIVSAVQTLLYMCTAR